MQKVDTTLLGLSEKEAEKYPYIASMGVYMFRTDVLLKLLTQKYLSCNDFGSEIIPLSVKDHNVQVSDCSDLIFLCSSELFLEFHPSWFLDLSKLGLNSQSHC